MKKIMRRFFIMVTVLFSVTGYSQVIKGTYAIKNVKTGMLLRIKDANKSDGTPLVAYSPVNWKCVTWNFNHLDDQTYQLENLLTGKTIQSANQTPSSGDALEQRPISNAVIQQYEFIPDGKNVYLIKLKGSDLYITPSDDKGTINAPIILLKRNNSKLQQWTIYEQHPEI
ncbi:MAG: RICIN domain-containing protein [Ginsengibacter sp.]